MRTCDILSLQENEKHGYSDHSTLVAGMHYLMLIDVYFIFVAVMQFLMLIVV